jgi:hypothetical protein
MSSLSYHIHVTGAQSFCASNDVLLTDFAAEKRIASEDLIKLLSKHAQRLFNHTTPAARSPQNVHPPPGRNMTSPSRQQMKQSKFATKKNENNSEDKPAKKPERLRLT